MSSAEGDDSFELYDLRVEVVCPPGERILCGAKSGDHFTLEGELLRLPPGQGFSIYSLGAFVVQSGCMRRLSAIRGRPSTPGGEAAFYG
jgi:hypothetical protein